MPIAVLDQAQAFASFVNVPAVAARPLRAHISGPHAALVRYAETTERDSGNLGFYDAVLDASFDWPNQPSGSVIDPDYAKLWMKNAILKYYSASAGSAAAISKVSGYANRIHSTNINFKTNGANARNAAFHDRDVQVGDVAKVRGVDTGGDPITLWTTVKSLIGDIDAAVVDAATEDADNDAAQGASTAITQVAGAENCVALTANATAYDGLRSGYVTETYDILVTGGSTGGDYTTATIRVISGSGTDDQSSVTPSAAASPTAVGTRGLTVTFNELDTAACSSSASVDEVSADDLIVGQRWHVVVHQAFAQTVATSGGTYDGDDDTTYAVSVSRGGSFGESDTDDQPQITVTTLDGTDISGPTNVASEGTAYAVGTHGVTISFSGGTGLLAGDKYYIECAASSSGALRGIVLNNNLDADIAAGTLLDVDLYIPVPLLSVPKNRSGFAPQANWAASTTSFDVEAGMVVYDNTWTDDGTELPLTVESSESAGYGEMFVEYRAWLNDLTKEVAGIAASGTDAALATALDTVISGVLHPDNPLKWGVYMALRNANGSEVKFTAVANPSDLSDWADAVGAVVGRDDVYGLVPLTQDSDVIALYAAHVAAMSADNVRLFRKLWRNLPAIPVLPLVTAGSVVAGHTEATTSDGEVCLCTITDDPNTTGTQYTLVTCAAGNANFVTNGVTAGDTLRANYVNDGFGAYSWTEYEIAEVESENSLLLVSGPASAVNAASKTEVWRTLSSAQEAAALATVSAAGASALVCNVWPDTVLDGSTEMDGYHVCAALAGLSSAILPHQGMARMTLSGITDVKRTYKHFLPAELDVMRDAGIWIVNQDPVSGDVFTRDAVTSFADETDLLHSDEMCVRNLHSILARFRESLDGFKGITNAVETVRQSLNIEAVSLISALQSEAATSNLGSQLIAGTVIEVRRNTVLQNRFVITISLTIPVSTGEVVVVVSVLIG